MARFLEKILNLQPGDLARGGLLFSYLFFVMASYVIGKTVGAALFLDQFKASKMSYALMAITLLVGFVAAGYVAIARRTALRNLLIGSLLLYAATCALFWYLAVHFGKQIPWLYSTIFIWVGIFGVLAPAQVWTLANFVLTTREAKRVFGIVGSGAITGGIVAGWLTTYASKNFGVESLLLIMAGFLAISVVLVLFIWSEKRSALQEASSLEGPGLGEGSVNLRESLKLIVSSRYLLAICAVICMSSLVTASAKWQFTAIAKEFKPDKAELAEFLGGFNFYAGLASLFAQLLLTSRVLRRFGIGPALFILPVTILMGTGSLLIWGTLIAASALRGGDQVLRYSIDKSTVELLFLPIPQNVKIQVKSFIDVVVWRLGDGLSGVAVALFADQLKWTPLQVSWVNITFIMGWLAAAFVARRQYVATLRECIQQHRLDAERAHAPVLDRSTANILADNFSTSDPQEILYALSLFEVEHQRASHPAVRGLLSHPAPEVRVRAISLMSESGDKSVLPEIKKLMRDPMLEVRTEALMYLTHHSRIDPLARIQELGDFPDFSIRSAIVAFLAHPGEAQNVDAARILLGAMAAESGEDGRRTRLEAARLAGTLPDLFEDQLRALLLDADPEVRCEAIRSVGKLRKLRFVSRLLEYLGHPDTREEAADALGKFGDRITGTLTDHLGDPHVALEIRRELPAVLVRTGSAACGKPLVENLIEGDTTLRFRILSALNKLRQAHPGIQFDPLIIETVLIAEIMGHYRSYQILGTLGEAMNAHDPVAQALRDSMQQEVERIFRLLGLLHPTYDLHSAYFGIQSKSPVVHDNSLEFLDNVLKPQMRQMLVPLLDSAVSVGERVALANKLVGAAVESREEAVSALVSSPDPWLKSCGAYAIGILNLRALADALEECLNHADPLLRETARQAKLRLAAG